MPKCVPCGEKNKVKKPKPTPKVDTSQDKLDYIKKPIPKFIVGK